MSKTREVSDIILYSVYLIMQHFLHFAFYPYSEESWFLSLLIALRVLQKELNLMGLKSYQHNLGYLITFPVLLVEEDLRIIETE